MRGFDSCDGRNACICSAIFTSGSGCYGTMVPIVSDTQDTGIPSVESELCMITVGCYYIVRTNTLIILSYVQNKRSELAMSYLIMREGE